MARLAGRCVVLAIAVWMYCAGSDQFFVLEPMGFFSGFSILHLLWGLWVMDMLWQLIPAKRDLALGSKKLFAQHFRPAQLKVSAQSLKNYIITTTKLAYRIFIIWGLLIAALGVCHGYGWLGDVELFMVSVLFYVCDLICVLIWCPFRLLLKNRCCTTCRIFNWDHLMMFTPMVFVNGIYSRSLLAMSLVVWAVWELSVLMHPERFWWQSNAALQCANCTDKLCTQYCQKLREK